MRSMTTKATRTTLWLTLAAAGLAAPAAAEDAPPDAPKAAEQEALAAEQTFLRASFVEREARDFARAERAYAAAEELAKGPGGSRDLLARALLGRARCLRALDRGAEADALLDRIVREFADVAAVAEQAKALRAPASAGDASSLRGRIHGLLASKEDFTKIRAYGDRAVPALAEALRFDDPDVVTRASVSLRDIGTDAAWTAIEDALADPDLFHPGYLAGGFRSHGGTRDRLVTIALRHRAPAVREAAAWSLILRRTPLAPDSPFVAQVLADPELRSVLGNLGWNEGGRSIAFAALASADAAVRREAGSALLARAHPDWPEVFAPPSDVLAHDDSVDALLRVFWEKFDWRTQVNASRDLVRAVIRVPSRRHSAVNLLTTSAYEPTPADRELLLAACATPPEQVSTSWTHDRVAQRVLAILGPEPSDADLRLVVPCIHWGKRLDDFLDLLQSRGALDDARLTAVVASVRPEFLEFALEWVTKHVRDGAVGPAALDAFLARIVESPATHGPERLSILREALAGGTKWPRELRPLAKWLAPAATSAQTEAAASFVAQRSQFAPVSADLLLPHLTPDHPGASSMVTAAVRAKLPGLEAKLEGWLRDPAFQGWHAAWALTELRGEAAEPVLAHALEIRDDAAAADLARYLFEYVPKLGSPAVARLISGLAAARPAAVPANRSLAGLVVSRLRPEDARSVCLTFLQSRDDDLRLVGAEIQVLVRDPQTWDALVAAARDGGVDTRDRARQALAAIERDRIAIDEVVTKARVRELLRSAKLDDRRAAIAGAVATRSVDLVPELLRLAVEDTSADVRADARAALVALGTATPAPAAPATPK